MDYFKFGWYVFGIIFLIMILYHFYPESKLKAKNGIDKIIVYKSKRKMEVYCNGALLKTYTISLGKCPIGEKAFEGDNKTPEGVYFIDSKNPKSRFYKNLGVSYPNKNDVEYAKKIGKSAGGDIKIHGLKNGKGFIGKWHRYQDWTAGCIAVTNYEMEELYNAVKIEAMIQILP